VSGSYFQTCKAASLNWSARRPKPGILAVQPKPEGAKCSIRTLTASPGSAPSIWIGPVTGLTLPGSRASTSATVARRDELSRRAVETLELQGGSRCDRLDGRDRTIPPEMMIRTVDGVVALVAHRCRRPGRRGRGCRLRRGVLVSPDATTSDRRECRARGKDYTRQAAGHRFEGSNRLSKMPFVILCRHALSA
jgi:hypothetical protein